MPPSCSNKKALILAVDDAKDGKGLNQIDVNFSDFSYDLALIESGDKPLDLLIHVSPQLPKKAAGAKFPFALVKLKTADERDKQRIDAQKAILDAVRLLLDEKRIEISRFFCVGQWLEARA